MSVPYEVGKEVRPDSADGAHGAPIDRLRARFEFSPRPAPSILPRPEAAVGAESPAVSLLDLPPGQLEVWAERVCIMHFDGELPWPEAEAAALADVLRRSERAGEGTTGRAPQ
jgi:hypothetical protein